MGREQPLRCPACESTETIGIMYGLPAPEMFRMAEEGLIRLGGCCEELGAPDTECKTCGHQWNRSEARE